VPAAPAGSVPPPRGDAPEIDTRITRVQRLDAVYLEQAAAPVTDEAAPAVVPPAGRPVAETAPAAARPMPTGDVELALAPASAFALSSDPERPDGGAGDRGHDHEPGPRFDAVASPGGARPERGPEAGGAVASARTTPEDVVRQVVPRLAALPRTGRHEIVLRLDPPTLGTVRIEASLDGRELTLRIRAEDAGARELLEQGLPQLRRALEQEGISPGRVSVQLSLEADTRQPAHGAPFQRPALLEAAGPPPAAPAPRAARSVVSATGIDLWV
jgi:flagellar hook-length control protein FliK